MASNLQHREGSYFFGNPIIYSVQSHAEPEGGCAFHRVILEVSITASGRTGVFELSQPVSYGGETVFFDISSVFRSMCESFEYQPVTAIRDYPVYTATIQAKDVWLKDGQLIDPAPTNAATTAAVSYSAVPGAFSDFERLHTSQTLTFSRKPLMGEVVCVGDNVVFGHAEGNVPYSKVRTITEADLANPDITLANGQHVYAIARTKTGSRMFQFVNSRGVVESIRSWQKEKEVVKGGSEEHTISRFETFRNFSRILTTKKATRTEFSFSSGFVSYEWALWWIHEFGQSRQYWMLTDDGIWLPCSVTIDESATVIDRSKADLCSVDFLCKPNINGPLF